MERKRCSEHKETEGHGILSFRTREHLWVTEGHKSHQPLPVGAEGMNTTPGGRVHPSEPAAVVCPAPAAALPPAPPRCEINF